MKGIFVRALEKQQKVVVMYMDKNQQLTQRVVKVLKVNEEYVLVYCFFRKKLRTLRMDHILAAEPMKAKLGA